MTDPAVTVSVSHDGRGQVIADIEYRIAHSWFRIMRETSEARAGRPVGNSRSILFEFHDLAEVTKAAVDENWRYILDICRASEMRPAEFVPRAAQSIGSLTKRVIIYANDRSVAGSAFGETEQINAAGRNAANAVAQHIEVTTREALLGYAAGRAIFPRSQWPLTRWEKAKAWAGSASLFLTGTVVGAVITKAVDAIFS